jgi:hypothetical protein
MFCTNQHKKKYIATFLSSIIMQGNYSLFLQIYYVFTTKSYI